MVSSVSGDPKMSDFVSDRRPVNGMFPCACCGYLTIGEVGGYEICHVCGWEDDPSQEAMPTLAGGANKVSLQSARQNFTEFGVCDGNDRSMVRPPREHEIPPKPRSPG